MNGSPITEYGKKPRIYVDAPLTLDSTILSRNHKPIISKTSSAAPKTTKSGSSMAKTANG